MKERLPDEACFIARSLGRLGTAVVLMFAAAAVPALLKAMSATNVDKRFRRQYQQAITNALWAIDPSVDPNAEQPPSD